MRIICQFNLSKAGEKIKRKRKDKERTILEAIGKDILRNVSSPTSEGM